MIATFKKEKKSVRFLSAILIMCVILSCFININVYADSTSITFTWKNISNSDMRKKSDIKVVDLKEYLKKYPYLKGIEETLVNVQDEYDVNMILLLAIIRLESGNGKSNLAQYKNNLGGIRGKSSYASFKSKNECIVYMANLLSDKYLTKGGAYHKGYTLSSIAKSYSAAPERWTRLISELIIEIEWFL